MSKSKTVTLRGRSYTFHQLKELMAKANEEKSGDQLQVSLQPIRASESQRSWFYQSLRWPKFGITRCFRLKRMK